MNLTTSGLSIIDIPAEPVTILTNWNKALDFSGSNERTQQVNSNSAYNPLQMNGLNLTATRNTNDATKTSNDSNARPWATAIVFKIDGHNSNQHIWNSGEGSSSGNDNIYVRLSASKNLYFGWGRDGSVNEVQISSGGTLATNQWLSLIHI